MPLHLDVSYQHIIHSTIRKWLIDSQQESEEKQRLPSIIKTILSIEYTLAQLRQETEDNEVAMGVLQSSADNLARKLPDIEDLVNMATVVSKKALQKFLLVKCKEQTIEFTKKFKLRGNTQQIKQSYVNRRTTMLNSSMIPTENSDIIHRFLLGKTRPGEVIQTWKNQSWDG